MSGFRAVFLDRDGVLNETIIKNGKSYPPSDLKSYRLFPGVKEALGALSQNGFKLIVVTNQPDVGSGKQSQAVVEEIHDYLSRTLPIDLIKACYHTSEDACSCRKPLPGMLHEAARELAIDLKGSYMVGDRWSDVDAGRAAGCRTFWVQTDYDEKKPENPDWTVESLLEASQMILRK